ncbi:MAG: DUF1674 domain-containing protein [Alphaproteobacteria bacterium]|nr:DUF1674 domain-containing protein [Alphaproteobacteria bacterium]
MMNSKNKHDTKEQESEQNKASEKKNLGHQPLPHMQREYGGRKGPEATRYNDWELNGKCVDF